jgi:hypothetical protein
VHYKLKPSLAKPVWLGVLYRHPPRLVAPQFRLPHVFSDSEERTVKSDCYPCHRIA